METKERIAMLARQAAAGSQAAFNDLYLLTRDRAYFVAFSIAKDEQDALDIVQDAYMKAWQHVAELAPPWAFGAWLQKITGNTAKNYVRQRKPQLFQPAGEREGDILGLQAEKDESYIPDAAMDTAETRRLIMGIVDSLPEDQRLCVLMYYYDDIPLGEIAAALEIPCGTVMSRLYLARRKIGDGVEQLEKKGTKLYGAAPIPLLLWLLRHIATEEGSRLLPPLILGSAAETGAAVGSAAAGGVAAVALPKLVAGISAAVIVVCGAVAAARLLPERPQPVEELTAAAVPAEAAGEVTVGATLFTFPTLPVFTSAPACAYPLAAAATGAATTTTEKPAASAAAATAAKPAASSAATTTTTTTKPTTSTITTATTKLTTSSITTTTTTTSTTTTSTTTTTTTTTQTVRTMTVTFIDSSSPGAQHSRSETVTVTGAGSGGLTAPALTAMAGWTAKGWTTGTAADAEADGLPGGTITVSGDVTYYGLYERDVAFTFDARGGAPTPAPITAASKLNSATGVPLQLPVTMPPAPSRAGYYFAAWQDGDGYRYLPGESALPGNTGLRAVWTTMPPI